MRREKEGEKFLRFEEMKVKDKKIVMEEKCFFQWFLVIERESSFWLRPSVKFFPSIVMEKL